MTVVSNDTGIGSAIPNRDGPAIVTGRAKYTVDLKPARTAIGVIFRSPVAHARVVSVDGSEAMSKDGVLDVIVPTDVADLPLIATGPVPEWPILAQDKVRYVGEPIAAIIAESLDAAENALSAMKFDYEPLPFLLDPEEALNRTDILIHEDPPYGEGNRAYQRVTKSGDIEAAFSNADLVVSERFRTSKPHAMPLETHAALADWNVDTGSVTLWSSTQQSHVVRDTISTVFGMPASKVRVIKPFVGGAFGIKSGLHHHEALAILASKRLARPVKFVYSRKDEFSATVSRNPQDRQVEVALQSDGRIMGWREHIIQDTGAYAGISTSVLSLSEFVTAGPYNIEAIELNGDLVYTNKSPAGAFRGFGNPQATYTRELMIEICARELGLDPIEFRRLNLIQPDQLPMRNVNGLMMHTLPIGEALDLVLEKIDYDTIKQTKDEHTGIGLALMIEWGGGCRWTEAWDVDIGSVSITMHSDGSVVVGSDAADSGQGHATVFSQIIHDELGVPIENIEVVLADTASTPFGLGTYASRTMVVHGSALCRASKKIRDTLFSIAGETLEADIGDLELDISGGRVKLKGADTGKSIPELALLAHLSRPSHPEGNEPTALAASESFDTPTEMPDSVNSYGNFSGNYTCGATVAVVKVDPDTGKVTVTDWASAEDVGRVLHPELLDGQIQGGIAQGIGYALGEDLVVDESGVILNPNMADYQVPTSPQIPILDKLITIESKDPTFALEVKGVGESGITPAAAAIASAIFDVTGKPITSLPLSAEKVLDAMRQE